MKVYLAGDHGGFTLKEEIKKFLLEKGYDVEDCGAYSFIPSDDYPTFIQSVAIKVSEQPNSFGIILGGSGQAEMMLANKFKGIRAALFYSPRIAVTSVDVTGRESNDPFEIVKLTRLHNNANILSLGGRFLTIEEAITAVEIFLETPFSGEERHIRRITEISKIENNL